MNCEGGGEVKAEREFGWYIRKEKIRYRKGELDKSMCVSDCWFEQKKRPLPSGIRRMRSERKCEL